MKIVLDYNPDSGWITDKRGIDLFNRIGLGDHELTEQSSSSSVSAEDSLIKLKHGGFSIEDILTLKQGGLV